MYWYSLPFYIISKNYVDSESSSQRSISCSRRASFSECLVESSCSFALFVAFAGSASASSNASLSASSASISCSTLRSSFSILRRRAWSYFCCCQESLFVSFEMLSGGAFLRSVCTVSDVRFACSIASFFSK